MRGASVRSQTDWLTAHGVHYNPDDDDADQQYFYLRVWDRGPDTAAAELDYILDTALPLGDTGLSVTLTAHGIPGDHWIIAARPTTPDQFVPWDLDDATGVPPHGPHRYVAPLALIRWTAGVPTLEDARTRLRTLCEGGCCQVTVGDGKESHGMVSSLQDAIDLLADTGGKICVLPGVHEGLASLDGISDILIEGCGPRTILTNPRPEIPRSEALEFYTPVLSIVDCERITIKDLRIEAFSAAGIEAKISVAAATCARITIENVEFHALGNVQPNKPGPEVLEPPHSGLAVYGVTGLDVFDCRFTADAVPGLSCPLVLGSQAVRVHRCSVLVDLSNGVFPTPGGIHVRSTSRDVEIIGCRIEGGWGHGIALGHAILRTRPADPVSVDVFGVNVDANTLEPLGQLQIDEFDGCNPDPGDLGFAPNPPNSELLWLPAGPLEDLRIHDNVIRSMGLSGISTGFFFPAAFNWNTSNDDLLDGIPRFIVVAEIDIARNLIEGNVRNGRLRPDGFQNFDVAVGGIVLAASINAWIHENTIRNNGTSGGHSVPICGVGMIAAQNAVIEDNRIVDNGKKHPGGPFLLRGLRGGIAVWEATTVRAKSNGKPTFPATIPNLNLPETVRSYAGASAESAVIVRGNEVSQPLGKALWVRRGFGAITVTGNSLEGFGDPVDGVQLESVALRWKTTVDSLTLPARGALVEIVDYGYAMELTSPVGGTPELKWCDLDGGTVRSGVVLFNGNTCKLEWRVLGGCAASVAVSSLDAVSICSNVMAASMLTDYDGVTIIFSDEDHPIDSFMSDIFEAYSTMSFLLTHVYSGSAGTMLVQGNRVIEGKFDALFSIACSAALSPADDEPTTLAEGLILMNNVMSHCRAVDGVFTTMASLNVTVYKSEALAAGADCPYTITSDDWGQGRVLRIS